MRSRLSRSSESDAVVLIPERVSASRLAAALLVLLALPAGGGVPTVSAQQGRFLAKEDITVLGLGLAVQPAIKVPTAEQTDVAGGARDEAREGHEHDEGIGRRDWHASRVARQAPAREWFEGTERARHHRFAAAGVRTAWSPSARRSAPP